ncbi:DUF6019 family protein [Kribbella pittospori]|nr:DUF6019 family protein [Kribbella pittospori]
MEFFGGVFLTIVFLYALYHVVRVAVRDGMREALKREDVRVEGNEPDR